MCEQYFFVALHFKPILAEGTNVIHYVMHSNRTVKEVRFDARCLIYLNYLILNPLGTKGGEINFLFTINFPTENSQLIKKTNTKTV